MASKLDAGDAFPTTTLELVGRETVTLPDDMTTAYAALIFYRGYW